MDYTRKSIESVSLSCVSWCVFITVSLLSPPSLMTCIILQIRETIVLIHFQVKQ